MSSPASPKDKPIVRLVTTNPSTRSATDNPTTAANAAAAATSATTTPSRANAATEDAGTAGRVTSAVWRTRTGPVPGPFPVRPGRSPGCPRPRGPAGQVATARTLSAMTTPTVSVPVSRPVVAGL